MYIVHVFIHVKPECREAFIAETLSNTRKSIQEAGIARFDFMEQVDDPTRFVLVEAYRTPEDAFKHKETAHYQTWRDAVADMMEEPRSSTKFTGIAPDDAGWETPNP